MNFVRRQSLATSLTGNRFKNDNIIDIKIVSNYDKLQAILNKLETTKKKKEYFEKIYRENGTIVMKKKGYLCCKKEIAPLKDYYA